MPIKNPGKLAAIYERRKLAVRMRREGNSWAEIVAATGYTDVQQAQNDVSKYLKRQYTEAAQEADMLRAQHAAHLAELKHTAQEIMDRMHIHITAGGQIAMYDGKPVRDDMPSLAALDRLLKIIEREAKMYGLDAPDKLQSEVKINYTIEGVDMDKV